MSGKIRNSSSRKKTWTFNFNQSVIPQQTLLDFKKVVSNGSYAKKACKKKQKN